MSKFVIVLALSGTICACAAPPATTAETAKPAASPQAQAETRVCEDIEKESTGTRLGTDRVCKTVPANKEQAPQAS